MKKEKEQYKKLIRSIIVILLVACETIIFMHYWINIYNKYTVFPFFQKGHWMMAAMYIIYQMATLSALFLQMTQVSRAKLVSFPTWTQQISMQKVSIRKSLKIMMAV